MGTIVGAIQPVAVDIAAKPRHPLLHFLEDLHRQHSVCREGEVATYIPELGRANPDWFGIAICTIDGQVHEVGDTRLPFSIQSISKPFVYGLALQDHGLEKVLQHVGVEPSGDAFNSISLDPKSGRPLNPMINAGAIASAGLVKAATPALRTRRVMEMFASYVGHEVRIDEQVCRSESETGFRNRAIANLLRNFNMIEGDPDRVVEVYFQQCSAMVDCRDLAVMAATLAAGGVSPVTTKRVLEQDHVRQVLSVMATCGMYDFAGEWLFRVGMPAKSGVSGGLIGVLPGQMGIAVFSPRLDARGNSVRGIRVFNDLAAGLGLHMFRRTGTSRSFVRVHYNGGQVHSRRQRPLGQMRQLTKVAVSIGVWELQGHLSVYGMELIVRDILLRCNPTKYMIIDFRRVSGIDEPAARMLAQFIDSISPRIRHIIISHAGHHPPVLVAIKEFFPSPSHGPRFVEETDEAIEWCETQLLLKFEEADEKPVTGIEQFDLVNSFNAEQLGVLTTMLRPGNAKDGAFIIHEGDAADGVYFLLRGSASVTTEPEPGKAIRLSTCSGGMTFGEMALLDHKPRSASVRADGAVEYFFLPLEEFEVLRRDRPDIALRLLENLSRSLSDKLRRANAEIRALGA
jgi:glutaminase